MENLSVSPGIKSCCELITLIGCTDLPRSEGQKARSQNSNMTRQEKKENPGQKMRKCLLRISSEVITYGPDAGMKRHR